MLTRLPKFLRIIIVIASEGSLYNGIFAACFIAACIFVWHFLPTVGAIISLLALSWLLGGLIESVMDWARHEGAKKVLQHTETGMVALTDSAIKFFLDNFDPHTGANIRPLMLNDNLKVLMQKQLVEKVGSAQYRATSIGLKLLKFIKQNVH